MQETLKREPDAADGNTPHVEATIVYLRPEDGGRKTAPGSGYHSQFHYIDDGSDWDAIQTFGSPTAPLGEPVEASLRFTNPAAHRGRVHVGTAFEIREGPRVVGRGLITHVGPF
ncbi:MAG TPA: elongation factor Tu [Armatimonadota bacterium]|jgi:translation elongation factor EF-Tu-like GTPase